MSIDSIEGDSVYTLAEWLESDQASQLQGKLEEKIIHFLFEQQSDSNAFQLMALQLAWIGTGPNERSLLEKEIIALARDHEIELCGLFKNIKKGASKISNFVASHATAIAIGVAIAATGVGIAALTGYTLTTVIGGVAIAGAGSIFLSEESPNPRIPSVPNPSSAEELALLHQSYLPKIELPSSTHEIFVTENGVWANDQFFATEKLQQNSLFSETLPQTSLSNWQSWIALTNPRSFQTQGEIAFALGQYEQAIQHLDKAINQDPVAYLTRGAAQFAIGQYEQSLEDFNQFIGQSQLLPTPEFSEGFAKGLPKGVYESGKGLALFCLDFIKHPVHTSQQVLQSITTLIDLALKDEWGTIAEALSPEIRTLITQWDTLSSDERGALAGYAIGKLGADILVPGAITKVASKSVKSAQELVAICKNLHLAQETLILETAAGIGSIAIADIVKTSEQTVLFAEELGISAKEMGQLKQAGKLESTLSNHLEKLSPAMQESYALYKRAQAFLKPYTKQPMPEMLVRELIHQAGIPTFPRPQGIPENFLVKITKKGAGMEYIHPTNTRLSVRVMPGKPHSPWLHQQEPYVIQMKDGKTLDKFGNVVLGDTPDAHIPFEDFLYTGE